MKITIKRFDTTLPLPNYEKHGAKGFDLFSRINMEIPPHEIKPVPLNVAMQVPDGYALLLFVRSGTPQRKGLMLANGVGVIDPFYNGDKDEIVALLLNITDKPVRVEKGEQLVQGLFVDVPSVAWNEVESMETEGAGYWSTKETV